MNRRTDFPFKIGDIVTWNGTHPTIGIIYAPCPNFSDSWKLITIDKLGLINRNTYNSCSCTNLSYAENYAKSKFIEHLKKLDPNIFGHLENITIPTIKFFKE